MVKIEPIESEQDLRDYFQGINDQITDQWNSLFECMSPMNVDLTFCSTLNPVLFDGKLKVRGKDIRLVMINDQNLVNSVTKSTNQFDALFQIFKGNKSTILAVTYRKDADKDWSGTSYNIDEKERLLISMMLDASEGVIPGAFYFIKDIVYEYAEKYKSSNIVRILD